MDANELPSWSELEAPGDALPKAIPAADFRQRVIQKQPVEGLGFLQRFATKKIEKGAGRTFRAIAGGSEVDLENETVSVKGTDLDFYRTNPIGLPNHDANSLPIFLTRAISKRNGELFFTPSYAPPDLPGVGPLADAIYQNHLWRMEEKALADSGAMFSVRAIPKFAEPDAVVFNQERGGIDFKKQTLVEISDVTVGAYPRAQILQAKAAGVPMEPVLEWALGIVEADETLLVIERPQAEKIVKALDPSKGLEVFKIKAGESEQQAADQDDAPPWAKALVKRIEALEEAPTTEEPEEPEEQAPAASPLDDIDGLASKVLKKVDHQLVRLVGAGI